MEGLSLILLRLIAIALLIITAAGCSKAPEDSLRFALSKAPITLDPRFTTDAASSRINRLIYESLIDFDDSYRVIPALAEWQQLLPSHYRFQLRKDSRFHDGTPMTASDVKATYDSILNSATNSPHRAGFDMIQTIEVLDERTVDFKLNRADLLFPGRLVIGIMPATAIKANHPFNRQPIGSGPFIFDSWPEEGRLNLKRRSDGQRLSFVAVENPTVRVLKLMRGEIDMLQNDLPSEMISYLEGQREIEVIKGRGSNFTYLGFNLQDGDTGNLKLRLAIAHALDREAIIRYVMGGAATPASALLPPDHWAGVQLALYPYDPARARVLLKEAGYVQGRRPHLVYKTSSDPFRIRLATIIQQQLTEVGIDVELRSYDWGTFYNDIKSGRFQMFSLSWIGIKTPDIFRYAFYSSAVPPKGANRGRYSDSITDTLIEAAEAAPTLEQQADAYRKVQARLFEQLPYVPLWYEDHVFAARKGVGGYSVARDGNYDGLIHVTRN